MNHNQIFIVEVQVTNNELTDERSTVHVSLDDTNIPQVLNNVNFPAKKQ